MAHADCAPSAYNEMTACADREAIVVEHVILGIFLVVPLLIVAFLFSDELWQEHRQRGQLPRERRMDWRHPIRSLRHPH
ncbi:hypothetical protein [Paraburkholderia flava]|uniref:hypothetical protein n=1 Tax=Paraburkholderia flava TaxID=2547393 RepID=UPI00106147F3|nr:hypothetical protein [Paraburkholderia flava]